jgi:hypothetical protein
VFEALASLRGDVANESVQHSELAGSLQRDVLDPLVRLRDGGEAVHKLVSRRPPCRIYTTSHSSPCCFPHPPTPQPLNH